MNDLIPKSCSVSEDSSSLAMNSDGEDGRGGENDMSSFDVAS